MPAGVIPFPPLPPVPSPPDKGPDPRQARGLRLRGAFGHMVGADGEQPGVNLTGGYHASAVNVAELKAVIEQGLRHFTAAQLAERWEVDVRSWVSALLSRWVQRARVKTLALEGNALQLRVETEDDVGHYAWEFDVFCGR